MAMLPASPIDWMLLKVHGQINEWQVQSMENYMAFSWTIRRPTDVYRKPSGQPYERWLEPSVFILDIWNMPSRSVGTRLDSDQVVQVFHAKRWTSLIEWLDHVKLETMSKHKSNPEFEPRTLRKNNLARQREWWNKNKKVFRLLDLPSELRNMIYEVVIPDRIHPYLGSRNLQQPPSTTWSQQPFMQLVTGCKQIYLESSKVLLSRPFRVQKYRSLMRLLNHRAQRNRLTHLELALTHWDCSKVFRPHPAYGDVPGTLPSGPIRHLQTMELRQLTIIIAPPSRNTDARMFDDACQKDVIEFLLGIMWYWIRGQTVELAGCIKDGQRRMFEQRCRDECRLILDWRQRGAAMGIAESSIKAYYDWQAWLVEEQDGGIWLDGRGEVARGHKNESSDLEPKSDTDEEEDEDEDDDMPVFPCSCEPRCSASTWTNEDLEDPMDRV
nr:hypothetical protein CFP56_09179 [Quercus suber]